jgi:catechol 2,3-dioxygenase-like lactoylglutathione lyase family enzyme
MLARVTIRVDNLAAAEPAYGVVLDALGVKRGPGYGRWGMFSLEPAGRGQRATRGAHIGFVAPSRAAVGAFWEAGLSAQLADDGAPGPRAAYGPDYYGGFLRDDAGNSIEAARHDGLRNDGGCVDHVWMRVSDLAASRALYDALAPTAGLRVVADEPGRLVRYRGPLEGGGSRAEASGASGRRSGRRRRRASRRGRSRCRRRACRSRGSAGS